MISFTLTQLVVDTLARYRILVTLAIYKTFTEIHVRKFTASANEGKPTALTPNLNITHT